MPLDVEKFKKLIETELREVEGELKSVGRVNPENPADWEPTPAVKTLDESDPSDVADDIEEYEEHTAVLKELEIRFNELKAALERIKNGCYGVCAVCNRPIEEARLLANPGAATCIEHREVH